MAQRSLDRRLTTAVISTTAGSVIVACLLFGLYDHRTGRAALIERSEMLARVVALSSSVAMAFDDDLTAQETLDGLSGTGLVRAAAVYDGDGTRFVEYRHADGDAFDLPAPERSALSFVAGRLDLFEPLVFEGQEVGTLYIAFDASSLTDRIGWYAAIVGVVIAGAALLSAWGAARLRRLISHPISQLAQATRAISEGDLSVHAPEDREDEIGGLARTFNEMTDSLQAVVAQTRQSIGAVAEVTHTLEYRGAELSRESQRQNQAIAHATESLQEVGIAVGGLTENAGALAQTAREAGSSIQQMQGAIGEIATHMDHLTEAIDTTSAATVEVTTNIDHVVEGVGTLQTATGGVGQRLRELTSSVAAVQSHAAETLETSESAGREAADGQTAVTETIRSMGAIADSFGQLERHVTQLADKSESIDKIVQVIQNVAEQTGLLALNAAIIAAHSGEHGQAFSVVADQVRTLADRSQHSAREIAELIRDVQVDTRAAVTAVSQGSSVVEHGVQRSERAGQVLARILESTATSTGRVRQIVEATDRQSDDLRRVDHAVRGVSTIVETIDRSMHEQHRATLEIARSIEHIRELGSGVRRSTEEQRQGSHQITMASSNLIAMATEMVEALEAQSRSSEAIQQALTVFVDVTEETARGVEAINESVATLSERAKQLEDEIGRFGPGSPT